MKRRLLALTLLTMLLGTTGAVFAQPGFVQQSAQAIVRVEQLVASKTQNVLSAAAQSDIVDLILSLLAETLLLGGLIVAVKKTYSTYSFSFTQALVAHTPDKEKNRRFGRDDIL